MPPREATRNATYYLRAADRLLPGKINGFYLVGSVALNAWRTGCSDIDFVAFVDGVLDTRQLRRLRLLHVAGNATAAGRALAQFEPSFPGTMNGVFVSMADAPKPVTQIRALAAHSGWKFTQADGFDVNPISWKLLQEGGITLRGPKPGDLRLDPEPDRLRPWNLEQLRGHWKRWAERLLRGNVPSKPLRSAHRLAISRVLGPPRSHHTLLTGNVISKEAAAEYALDTFDRRWHPVIRAALAQRDGQPPPHLVQPDELIRMAGEFTLEVVADAEQRSSVE